MTSPEVLLVSELEFQRGTLDRCRRFDVKLRGDTWIIMAQSWLQCCARCGCSAEYHWDGGWGPCDFSNDPRHHGGPCPIYRKRVLVKRHPTERDVLRFIDTMLDVVP